MGNACLARICGKSVASKQEEELPVEKLLRRKGDELLNPRDDYGRHDAVYHAVRHPGKFKSRKGETDKYVQGFVGDFDISDTSTTSSEESFCWTDGRVTPVTHFELPYLDQFFPEVGQSDQDLCGDTGFGIGDNVVVIKFFRTDCVGSANVEPFYISLSSAFPKVVFLEADVVFNKKLTVDCQITATPTFVVFCNGKEVSRLVGVNVDDVQSMIATFAPHVMP